MIAAHKVMINGWLTELIGIMMIARFPVLLNLL